MPTPSRDRLARPVDISTLFHGAARRVDLVVDEPGLIWSGLSGNQNPNVPSSIGGRGSPLGQRRVSGYVRSRNLHRSGLVGRENRMVGRRNSGRGRVLPSWYPRTPLRDITAIVRAIERRRAEIHGDDQVADAPHQEETNALPSPSNAAQLLEQEVGESTPMPTIATKPQPSPSTDQASKIVEDSSNLVTPQQKLLNSIDQVREIWLQEQRKLEKTPAAKKAEREKKIRTLMSMR